MRFTIVREDLHIAEAELRSHFKDPQLLGGWARPLDGYASVRAAAEAAHLAHVAEEKTGGATLHAHSGMPWQRSFTGLALRDRSGTALPAEFVHLLADPADDPPEIWVVARLQAPVPEPAAD